MTRHKAKDGLWDSPVIILRVLSHIVRLELEELGDVVEEGEGGDDRDVAPALADSTNIPVERFADGEESLGGDHHHAVDAPRQSDLKCYFLFLLLSLILKETR